MKEKELKRSLHEFCFFTL